MKSLLTALLIVSCVSPTKAARFLVNGPVVTLTLKDPQQTPATSSSSDASQPLPWLDLGALSPNAVWQITSTRPPLPNWLPSLKQLALKAGYQYHSLRRLPQ